MPDKTYSDITPIPRDTRDLESKSLDIDGKISQRTIKGKSLENLFNMVNSSGFLDGEIYTGFLVTTNPISEFITFHFFNQGEESFQVILGFNASKQIGAVKVTPGAAITGLNFIQGLNLGNEPAGSLLGVLVAFGGTAIVFTIIQDLTGFFALQNNNELISLTPIPEGSYDLIIKVNGQGGVEYVDQITVLIVATALISNINLSNLTIEETASIGTAVGALSTNGGEDPITYTLLAQKEDDENGNDIDLLEINVSSLRTKALMGVAGTNYFIAIQAEDSRFALPDDQRIRVETFTIQVVADTFLNAISLNYDSIDEYMSAAHDISMWGGSNFSGSVWIKPNNKGSGQYVLSKFQEAGKRSWALRVNANATIAVIYSQTGVASDTTTGVTGVTFGAWTHVAFSFDGTLGTPKMKIWVNGVLDVDEDTLFTTLYNNSDVPMLIGALNQPLPTSASAFYDGLIDEPSIYNISLDQTQVDEIYNLGSPTNIKSLSSASALISWWRGDNFSGSIDPDEQGVNDMTGINMNNSNKTADVP